MSATYHHGNLELSLIEQAVHEIENEGSAGLSLRHVASQVGVSPSAAYHHFSDKQELLNAVGGHTVSLLGEAMKNAVDANKGDSDRDALDRLSALFDAYVGFAQRHPNLFMHAFGPLCESSNDQEALAYQVLQMSLDELELRGLLRSNIREGLDQLMWAHVHGISLLILGGHVPSEVIVNQRQLMERLILK